jgi:hypothetical protein
MLYLLPYNTTPIQIHISTECSTLNRAHTNPKEINTGTKICEYNEIVGKITIDVRSSKHPRMLNTI